jgi:hypothetical protein
MRLLTQHPRRRRGTVLAYVALLLFGMLAITAMVSDIGFAVLARRMMLTAVDSAALEGLRGRDDESVPAQLRDHARRLRASLRVSEIFDDDFVFDHNPDRLLQDRYNYGAGPVFQFSEGIPLQGTSFRASERFSIGANPMYDPVLRLNETNSVAGDMVSGSFFDLPVNDIGLPATPGVAALASLPSNALTRHVEQSNYTRDDFIPDVPQTGLGGSAFLVRLRRSNEQFSAGSQESSAGPPLPYLFGRGTLLDPETKARGITVRATAIADARRAMSIGLPFASVTPPLPGATSFALERSFWDGLSSREALIDSNGQITGFRLLRDKDGNVIGVEPTGERFGQFILPATATSIGRAIQGTTGGDTLTGYVPIFQALPTERVIGFGRASLTLEYTLFGYQIVLITKLPSIVAPENASAVLTDQLNLVDTAELANVLAAYESFRDPLLAPALVR